MKSGKLVGWFLFLILLWFPAYALTFEPPVDVFRPLEPYPLPPGVSTTNPHVSAEDLLDGQHGDEAGRWSPIPPDATKTGTRVEPKGDWQSNRDSVARASAERSLNELGRGLEQWH